MQVIALVQRKGGVGKTTVAINLAGEIAKRGRAVTVVDADPQGSAMAWAGLRKLPFTVRHSVLDRTSLSIWIKNVLKTRADVVIVDTPGDLGPAFKATIEIADLVLMPCGPSSLDINAVRQSIAKLQEQAKAAKQRSPALVLVPTRVDPSTMEGQQISAELGELGQVVAPSLSNDIAFVRAFTAGEPVCLAAANSRADLETRALAEFVLARLAHTPPDVGSGAIVPAKQW